MIAPLVRRLKPEHSMAVALLALFVALGGVGYAALKLPKNSVGAKQIKKNAVRGAEIKGNAVRGGDVLESSLGEVPLAGRAKSLDGFDPNAFNPNAFAPADVLQRFRYNLPRSASNALVKLEDLGRGFTLWGRCRREEQGAFDRDVAELFLGSDAAGDLRRVSRDDTLQTSSEYPFPQISGVPYDTLVDDTDLTAGSTSKLIQEQALQDTDSVEAGFFFAASDAITGAYGPVLAGVNTGGDNCVLAGAITVF